jgi:hypothetical protein
MLDKIYIYVGYFTLKYLSFKNQIKGRILGYIQQKLFMSQVSLETHPLN